MAKLFPHSFHGAISGTVGEFVYRRCGDKVVVSRRPRKTNRPPTQPQIAMRERFARAAAYGRAAAASPELCGYYAPFLKKKRRHSVYGMALDDYLHAPFVSQVDLKKYHGRAGDSIRARVDDDVAVTAVRVRIVGHGGAILEEGFAREDWGGWSYVARRTLPAMTAVLVEVTGHDRPGNQGTGTATKLLASDAPS